MNNKLMMSLALALSTAAPAFAQDGAGLAPNTQGGPGFTAGGAGDASAPGGRFGRRGGGGRGARFAQLEAVLNPEQKAQFQQIMEQSRAEGKPLMEKMRAMKSSMQGGASMDDKTKAEFKALRQQLNAHHEGTQAKISALLTPDQKAQLAKTGGMPTFGGPDGEGPGGGAGFGGPGGGNFGGPGGPGGWRARRRAAQGADSTPTAPANTAPGQ